ncbi:7-cyano-7-deazaguanine synthase QueC [Hyphococcus luteus]|uniref:7-cyano-7-deazaguanine synthase n=1 Tax=Hyphococcus luteus TaxID=2058213 RepID=A0A2S7K964_9PROT|nr:7-cyano-7-deazaguanine synthase QueC [Marinicaulis flavus]PQA89047.1 7-cyano-7-deazaguanine synthase QueC [Marinicaulis flavus]
MRKLDPSRALILFSGGQDSSISLAWALDRFAHVETVGFVYGQRHSIELGARLTVRKAMADAFPRWAGKLGEDMLVDARGLKDLGETAMTHETEIVMGEDGLPTTFVPGRNLVFLSLAGGLAYRRNLGRLVAGMCETDYSGYPDCREPALNAQLEALRLGMDADFGLETPLMHIDKAESWRLAESLGGEKLVALINEHSHTCYRGERGARHNWGYGCGECPACVLRAKGWAAYSAGTESARP